MLLFREMHFKLEGNELCIQECCTITRLVTENIL